MTQHYEPKVGSCWTAGREYVTVFQCGKQGFFNASVLQNAYGGIVAGAADNGMVPPSSVPTGNMTQREKAPGARERVRLRHGGKVAVRKSKQFPR